MAAASPSLNVNERKTLPACRRCRHRKIRCIPEGPKCSACAQARTACQIVDPVTGKEYSRGYVHELELREQELLRKAREASTLQTSPNEVGSDAATAGTGGIRFVGESSSLR